MSDEIIEERQMTPDAPLMVDYWRQLDLFSPEKFGDKEVHVIGVGATGSWLALILAKIGVPNLHIWDFDTVEMHNIPGQMYRPRKDIGRPKVEALAEIIEEFTLVRPTIHYEKVTGATPLKGIVFLLVDKMFDRKEIWSGALKFKVYVDLMIETRMAIDNGRVYAIKPSRPSDVKFWEETLYSDDEVEEPACTNRSIAPTGATLASIAAWKLIKFTNAEEYERELIVSARPWAIIF
jgi:hypothetical protein